MFLIKFKRKRSIFKFCKSNETLWFFHGLLLQNSVRVHFFKQLPANNRWVVMLVQISFLLPSIFNLLPGKQIFYIGLLEKNISHTRG